MTDFDWSINGIKPFWISSIDDTTFPQVTLHCAAHIDDTRYNTPLDEIEIFKAIASFNMVNKPNMSGGTVLESSPDGSVIPISDGNNTYWGVLLFPQYTPDDMAETLIEFDLILQLQRLNNPITLTPPTGTTTKSYNKITDGYNYAVTGMGDATQYLGTFTFNWDGTGTIYIASSSDADPDTDVIQIDDAIVVTNAGGVSIDVVYGGGAFEGGVSTLGPPLEITSLLVEGDNEITIGLRDIYGNMLGCSSLFMVQVIPE